MSIQNIEAGDDEAARAPPVAAEGRPAEDKLREIRAIAEFIGESERRTFYLAERRYIPIGKQGSTWIASKKALREHYERITGAVA